VSVMSKLQFRRLSRTEWSMVSNAALRSSDTRSVSLLASAVLQMLSRSSCKAVSVEQPGRWADWYLLKFEEVRM